MKNITKRLKSIDSLVWFAISTFGAVLVVLGFIILSPLDDQVLFAVLLVLLAAWLAQIFSIVQTSKQRKTESARLVDTYRSALIRASVICLDNYVAVNSNIEQFQSLSEELDRNRFYTIKPLSYQKIDPSNFLNNNIYSSSVGVSQSLTVLKLNEDLLESINSDTTRIAHLIKMLGQETDANVTHTDRSLIKQFCGANIEILEDQLKRIEDLYNEINLHIDNLDYDLYLKNPDETIRKALFYNPSAEDIAKPTEHTIRQLSLAKRKYGFSKKRV